MSVLCLLLTALLLTACSGGGNNDQVFPEVTQNLGPAAPATPEPTSMPADDGQMDPVLPEEDAGGSIFDTNPYDMGDFTESDAIGEEDIIDPYADNAFDGLYLPEPEGTPYPYAGSTPIPLDPVDMPTPTPRAALSFSYAAYSAAGLNLTFEGPVAWQADESEPQVFRLMEPQGQVKDGQQCIITLSAEPVTSNYNEGDLKTQVLQRLDMLAGSEYTEWKPSYTATRYMLGSKGVYANYTATRSDGTEVGGRIQYVCVDHVLYGLEIIYPLGFKDSYMDVFGQIRNSLKTAN